MLTRSSPLGPSCLPGTDALFPFSQGWEGLKLFQTTNHREHGGARKLGRVQRVTIKGAQVPLMSSLRLGLALRSAGVYAMDIGINVCAFIQYRYMDILRACS